MKNAKQDLPERLLDFAAKIMKWTAKLRRAAPGRYVADQLMRAAASSGANYEEACGAESRADFIHKMRLVLKELRESLYWLKLTERAELMPGGDLPTLLDEAGQLARIVGKSVVTANRNKE